jgi:PHD/YefM family antitoxin component YafN of YafNO toxin-antitoxin module
MATLPVSQAKARLNELAKTAAAQHERFVLTRNGSAEAVLLAAEDLDGMELTVDVLSDQASVAAIAEALAQRERGEPAADLDEVREQLRRRTTASGE